MNQDSFSVYRAGAENGLVIGPLMIAAMWLLGASISVPMLVLPSLVFFLAVPVAAYIMLLRTYRSEPAQCTFSGIWLQGICMFFFGSLLLAIFLFVALRWLWPDFVIGMVHQVIDTYSQLGQPDAEAFADALREMVSKGQIPTPFMVATNFIYTSVFSGSLLSMLYAALIRRLPRNLPPTPPQAM